MIHKVHTRKKLLLREDEAEMIELALIELAKTLEQVRIEQSGMEIFALSSADKASCRRAAEMAKEVIAKTKHVLKLVQDAEVTETVVEL